MSGFATKSIAESSCLIFNFFNYLPCDITTFTVLHELVVQNVNYIKICSLLNSLSKKMAQPKAQAPSVVVCV